MRSGPFSTTEEVELQQRRPRQRADDGVRLQLVHLLERRQHLLGGGPRDAVRRQQRRRLLVRGEVGGAQPDVEQRLQLLVVVPGDRGVGGFAHVERAYGGGDERH